MNWKIWDTEMNNEERFKAIRDFNNESLDDCGALIFKGHYDKLIQQFKGQDVDQFFLAYWAFKLTAFEGDVELQFDTLPDPNKITITVYPDYGS